MSSFFTSPNNGMPIAPLPRRPSLPVGVTAKPETAEFYNQMSAHYASPAGKEEAWNGASPAFRQASQAYAETPIKPRTVYRADGSVENPPAHDPGFSVYNHVSEMPAQDQAEIHAFRGGMQSPSLRPVPRPPSPGDTTGGQMIGDPSKATPAIGVPARNQPASIGLQSMPPSQAAPSFSSHADMRNVMIENLSRQMQAAHSSGDPSTLHDLFAQRAALDNGGFAGHAKYMQDKAMTDAQMAHLGGGPAGYNPKTGKPPTLPNGSLDEESARMLLTPKLKDPQAVDHTIQDMRIGINRELAAKTGQPVQVNPNDAAEILASRYPAYAHIFAPDADGKASMGLADMYHNLKAMAPNLLQDPKSEFSQAARHRIQQLFGSDLPGQLWLPSNPSAHAESTLAGKLASATLDNGPFFDMFNWGASNLHNLVRGYPTLRPQTEFDRINPAVQWYNGLAADQK